jgi:PAS domain S-box-containing protein
METADTNRHPAADTDGPREKVPYSQQEPHAVETKNALGPSEERFQLLVDAVQDYAIFMLDIQGNVTSWNAGAKRIKGYEDHEIIGKHFSCFYPEEDVRSAKPERELKVAAAEGRFEEEGWRLRKDGSRFWANVILTALRDTTGKLLGYAKVTRDITERMFAQESLRAAHNAIAESENSLRRLSLRLLRTQDEERRRIGRDLHDSLGQYLSVLMIKLEILRASANPCSKSNTDKELEQCVKIVEESVKEVRTISYLLYPPMLEEMGLSRAIHWYLDGFAERSGIETALHVSPGFPRFSRESELALFRVLQEALANVHRHSGSATANIQLSLENGSVILIVCDKGKGIPSFMLGPLDDRLVSAAGVGLRGMNERMRELGGVLHLYSSDQGTTVTATVPLERCRVEDEPAETDRTAL